MYETVAEATGAEDAALDAAEAEDAAEADAANGTNSISLGSITPCCMMLFV